MSRLLLASLSLLVSGAIFSSKAEAQIFDPNTAKNFSSNPTPAAPPATGAPLDLVESILSAISAGMGPTNNDGKSVEDLLSGTLYNMVHSAQITAIKTGNALMVHARSVFFSIIGLVLAAQFTFVGFRIMLKENVVQALTEMTVSTFLLFALSGIVGTQQPTRIAETAMYQLTAAGRNVGKDIIHQTLGAGFTNPILNDIASNCAAAPSSYPVAYTPDKDILDQSDMHGEPAVYWLDWLGIKYAYAGVQLGTSKVDVNGVVTAAYQPNTPSTEYKFSYASLMNRFWGVPDLNSSQAANIANSAGWKNTAETYAQNVTIGVFTAMNPLRLLSQSMMLATIQTSAIFIPVMQQLGVFIGALMSFYVVAALGVSTLPLIYFKSFRDLWRTYLTVLAGIALIPCFYYIFSAIGFVFAANAYEALFPLDSSGGGSFAVILNTVYMKTMAVTLCIGSKYLGVVEDLFAQLVGLFFAWSLLLGRVMFASGVVASVISGGVSFAMMGGQIAYKWAQGFGAETMTDKVGEFFTGIQGATGSGLSGMYSRALSGGSEAMGGLAAGLNNR